MGPRQVPGEAPRNGCSPGDKLDLHYLGLVGAWGAKDIFIGRGPKSWFGKALAIEKYREHLARDRDSVSKLCTLSAARFVCHCCNKQACHKDIIWTFLKDFSPHAFILEGHDKLSTVGAAKAAPEAAQSWGRRSSPAGLVSSASQRHPFDPKKEIMLRQQVVEGLGQQQRVEQPMRWRLPGRVWAQPRTPTRGTRRASSSSRRSRYRHAPLAGPLVRRLQCRRCGYELQARLHRAHQRLLASRMRGGPSGTSLTGSSRTSPRGSPSD